MLTRRPLRSRSPLKAKPRPASDPVPNPLHPLKRWSVSAATWAEIRRAIFDRSGGFCEAPMENGNGMYSQSRCMKRIYFSDWEPHHVLPRAKGGQDSIDNVLAVCRACHKRLDGRILHWSRPA